MASPDHPPIPLYKPPTAPDGALATVRGIWTGTGIEVDAIEVHGRNRIRRAPLPTATPGHSSLPDSTSFEVVESIWSAAELMAADTALIRVPHTYAIGTRVGSDLQFRKHIDVFEVSPELDDALRHSPSGLIEPTILLTVER